MFKQILKWSVPYALEAGLSRRAPKRIAAKVAGGVLLLIGLVFALCALHQYLRLFYANYVVNAFFAGGFFLCAAGVFLVLHFKAKPKKSAFSSLGQEAATLGNALQSDLKREAAHLGQATEEALYRHGGKALAAAALAGLYFGFRAGRK